MDSGGTGKNDQIDAIAAAKSVLGQETDLLLHPRRDGERAAVSVLLAARRRVDHQRTVNRNASNALVRQIDLDIDARHALTDRQIREICDWRAREHDTVDQRLARAGAIDLAKSIKASKARLKEIEVELVDLDEKMAPGLQDELGTGSMTVGIILAVLLTPRQGPFRSRLRSPSGASPLRASSGNTKRHRLNRGGDRQLNRALDIIAKHRIRGD